MLRDANFSKLRLWYKVHFCKYYETFKNTFFTEKPQGDCFCISVCISFYISVFNRLSCFQYTEMLFCLLRSKHCKRSVKVKEGVLEKILMFTLQKTIVLESLFNKVADLKKRLQHRCFPMDTAKILWTPILKKICKQLILFLIYWVITAICFWQYIFS